MAGPSSTTMMNLLALVLVTLPGMTLSFSNTSPWRDLYQQLQEAGVNSQLGQPGRYECCSQPATRTSPNLADLRSLILASAQRDDRDAVLREALRDASRRGADNSGPLAIQDLLRQGRGGYPETETIPRDSLLAGILRALRSPGRRRDSGLVDYDGSALLGQRGLGAYVQLGKRENGELGGANVPWTWPPPSQQKTKQIHIAMRKLVSLMKSVYEPQQAGE